MSRRLAFLLQCIAGLLGALLGALGGQLLMAIVGLFLVLLAPPADSLGAAFAPAFMAGLLVGAGAVVLALPGTAMGVHVASKRLGMRGSWWLALLGGILGGVLSVILAGTTYVGLLAGLLLASVLAAAFYGIWPKSGRGSSQVDT